MKEMNENCLFASCVFKGFCVGAWGMSEPRTTVILDEFICFIHFICKSLVKILKYCIDWLSFLILPKQDLWCCKFLNAFLVLIKVQLNFVKRLPKEFII